MTVLDKFNKGDIRALSRIISYIEDQENDYRRVLGKLYSKIGHSIRIGITGPPGAGKSTLVNGLAHEFLDAGKKVGIIAVDPTSPFTGGALLGDRVRMNEFPADGSVYFRSMATRGAMGGLAQATDNVAVVYDAFGFDITLIETVGVGQVELDIINTCDTVVVVLVPESGDAVQAMKAGLMEIADIFCVNKADRPGSERIMTELKYALDTKRYRESEWRVKVVSTEATNRKNIDKLKDRIDSHLDFIRQNGKFESHRKDQLRRKLYNILHQHVSQEITSKVQQIADLDEIVDKLYAGHGDPYAIAGDLFKKVT